MKRLQIGAACLALLFAPYAFAAPQEARLGQGIGKTGGAKPTAAHAQAGLAAGGAARSQASPVSYGRALGRLRPDGKQVTRGAKESRIYQTASPSVVLIVTKDSLGSGALISADGRIVTNLHVVGDNAEVGVIFKPAQEGAAIGEADVRPAKVLRRDGVTDLALIQVADVPGHVKPLSIASISAVEVGSDVHAIGHPTGEAWTYTRGIVSQIRRDYAWTTQSRLKHQATVIQTQTPINPGNSGGPLIDDNLGLVGINSFKGDGEGLNYAVSADDVTAFLARPGDRVAESTVRQPPKDCKLKALEERPSKDPKGVELLMDGDCDDQGDFLLLIPDDKSEPLVMLIDDDGDGKIDTLIFDEGRDGKPDLALYDTDADGKFDMEGSYRDGESEPYRYEKIKAKG
jgi:S1-C subfamily serine protease